MFDNSLCQIDANVKALKTQSTDAENNVLRQKKLEK